MAKKKPPTLDPDATREQWVRARVNEAELLAVKTWLRGIDADSAETVGQQIAARLAERAPFANPAALLRAVLDLPAVSVGAPPGNQNHTGKPGANHHTKKAGR